MLQTFIYTYLVIKSQYQTSKHAVNIRIRLYLHRWTKKSLFMEQKISTNCALVDFWTKSTAVGRTCQKAQKLQADL